jgi:hypothetical protein
MARYCRRPTHRSVQVLAPRARPNSYLIDATHPCRLHSLSSVCPTRPGRTRSTPVSDSSLSLFLSDGFDSMSWDSLPPALPPCILMPSYGAGRVREAGESFTKEPARVLPPTFDFPSFVLSPAGDRLGCSEPHFFFSCLLFPAFVRPSEAILGVADSIGAPHSSQGPTVRVQARMTQSA